MKDLVSIVIPAFNELDYCRQCVSSLLVNTEHPCRLILVDNGSTDGVSEYFDSIPGATVIHSETNLGFAGGVNLGMAEAEGHVLLLNSDTVVPRGWLGRLVGALNRADDVGMVGPMSNCVSGVQQIDGLLFNDLDEISAYANGLAKEKAGQLRDVSRLVGFCLLIRDRVVAEVGRFDEAYGIGNFEDDDYGLRVARAGYRLCVAEDCFVFHYGSRTFVGMGLVDEAWQSLIEKNEAVFREKWESPPEDRTAVLQQSRQLNRAAGDAVRRGDLGEAVRLYRQAIEVAPEYELNYNDLGVVLWELGRREQAYENFVRTLRLNTRHEDARANLLAAASELGREEEAERLVEELQGGEGSL